MMSGAPVPTLTADKLLMTWLDPDGSGPGWGGCVDLVWAAGRGRHPSTLPSRSLCTRDPIFQLFPRVQELQDGHLQIRPKSSPSSLSAPRAASALADCASRHVCLCATISVGTRTSHRVQFIGVWDSHKCMHPHQLIPERSCHPKPSPVLTR